MVAIEHAHVFDHARVALPASFCAMSSPGDGGPPAKRKRLYLGQVPKCGKCKTCMTPSMKRACLVNRPPEQQQKAAAHSAAARIKAAAAAQASALESLPEVELEDRPVPPHGIAGFRLPIEPAQRARKWTRQWCARAPTLLGGRALRAATRQREL